MTCDQQLRIQGKVFKCDKVDNTHVTDANAQNRLHHADVKFDGKGNAIQDNAANAAVLPYEQPTQYPQYLANTGRENP